MDADVRLEPEGLARVAHALRDADVVSAFPRQRMVTWAERLVVPLLSVTYTSWLPLRLVRATQDPRLTAANGQILAIRRHAYSHLGGFASVRCEIVDDVAIVRRAKGLGLRADFIDGDAIATCRMYRSSTEVWRGFSKNLYEGIGASPAALAGVSLAYAFAFVVPYVASVTAAATSGAWLAPALVGVGLNLILRVPLAVRFRHGVGSVVLHPVAVLGLLAIALNSYRWSREGSLRWGGRTYASRTEREAS